MNEQGQQKNKALAGAMKRDEQRRRKNAARRAKHQAMLDIGLVRVRGNLGGVYYE